MKTTLDSADIENQDQPLREAAGQAFYNTSPFTLRDLRSRANQQQLRADFIDYLDGFSPNVQDILEKFEFHNQIPRLSKADALGALIEKFLDPAVNLSPYPVKNPDGSVRHPAWTTMPWARSSRNWYAASTRRTTKRPASTGLPATPSG